MMDQRRESIDDFAGQTIVVTGAAGGVGREVATRLGARGGKLVLCDVVAAERTASANEGVKGIAAIHRLDSSDRASVEAVASGLGQVDVLVDTGGVCPRDDWMADDWDATFDHVINVNVRGPINLARAFMPPMMERGHGRIVLCGSLAGWTGGLRTSPHYAASKGGVHALVRWLATRATPKGVCVNGVAPGPVDSAMTEGQGYDPSLYPQKRMGQPSEVASLIAYLASPSGGFVSGSVVDCNGGIYFR